MDTLNITANKDAFEYEVSGLEKFTVYNIQVKAFTAIGSGQVATKEVKTSEDSKLRGEGHRIFLMKVYNFNLPF